MNWRIYYDDGSTFSSEDGLPEEAPLDGIQGIAQEKDNGVKEFHEGFEYYYWMDDCWAHGRINSLERWLRKVLPALKYGRFTSNKIHKKAMEDLYGSSSGSS